MMFARLGAVAYLLWGLLHLYSARITYQFAQTLEPGLLQGRLHQHAWNLLFFALFAIVVAVTLNWKNSRAGNWANLVVVGAADIGFIVTVLVPGHIPWIPGALGPLLWVVALAPTTLAIRRSAPAAP